jgi:hypothetical protein
MSQSSSDVAATPLTRSPPASPLRHEPPDHVSVQLNSVLRDFEPDLGQPLSAALSWDFIWPELSDHILSKQQYLETHPEDSGVRLTSTTSEFLTFAFPSSTLATLFRPFCACR